MESTFWTYRQCGYRRRNNHGTGGYETIRLIDYEGLTQEECSERMNVARTTVGDDNDARKFGAAAGRGRSLSEGGDYKLYDENEKTMAVVDAGDIGKAMVRV